MRTSRVPKTGVFPRLLYCDPRSSQACHWRSQACDEHSQACHQCTQVLRSLFLPLPDSLPALPGAPRCTWRPLHRSSQLWDLTTLGFRSNNSQILPEAPSDKTTFCWSLGCHSRQMGFAITLCWIRHSNMPNIFQCTFTLIIDQQMLLHCQEHASQVSYSDRSTQYCPVYHYFQMGLQSMLCWIYHMETQDVCPGFHGAADLQSYGSKPTSSGMTKWACVSYPDTGTQSCQDCLHCQMALVNMQHSTCHN